MRRRGAALFTTVAAVALLVMGVFAAATMLIVHFTYGWPWWSIQRATTVDDPTVLEPMRVALTIAAGLGGAVALVVAYRRQRMNERQEPRDQYISAVAQLGASDPITRLAGVYALAQLADAWPEQRQQCVDVLSARLRLPWDPELDLQHPLATKTIELTAAEGLDRTTYTYPNQAGEVEVRETILRVIAEHLRPNGRYGVRRLSRTRKGSLPLPTIRRSGRWSEFSFDLTGARIPRMDWSLTTLETPPVFAGATFTEHVNFGQVTFLKHADFKDANFNKGVSLSHATFTGDANFLSATFTQGANFHGATFMKNGIFADVTFSQWADFSGATFAQHATFGGATFTQKGNFRGAAFTQTAIFESATFSEESNFESATFADGAYIEGSIFSQGAPPELQAAARPLAHIHARIKEQLLGLQAVIRKKM